MEDGNAGSPGPTVVEYAQKRGIGLIVMGQRSLGRVVDLLLGSVCHRVTQLADCACLIVEQAGATSHSPLTCSESSAAVPAAATRR